MIESIIKYWKLGAVIAAAIGGLISMYLIPSVGGLLVFLLDLRQVQGSINDHELRLKKVEEVVIRSDERYKNIETYMRNMDERDRQERLFGKR